MELFDQSAASGRTNGIRLEHHAFQNLIRGFGAEGPLFHRFGGIDQEVAEEGFQDESNRKLRSINATNWFAMTVFKDKLDLIPATIALADDGPIEKIARALRASRGKLAVVIGSGGSAIAAEYFWPAAGFEDTEISVL